MTPKSAKDSSLDSEHPIPRYFTSHDHEVLGTRDLLKSEQTSLPQFMGPDNNQNLADRDWLLGIRLLSGNASDENLCKAATPANAMYDSCKSPMPNLSARKILRK